jgi:hypothetical protein
MRKRVRRLPPASMITTPVPSCGQIAGRGDMVALQKGCRRGRLRIETSRREHGTSSWRQVFQAPVLWVVPTERAESVPSAKSPGP